VLVLLFAPARREHGRRRLRKSSRATCISFQSSAEGLLLLLLGSRGAVGFVVARHLLAEMAPPFWQFRISLTLVAVAQAGRGGALGVLGTSMARLRSSVVLETHGRTRRFVDSGWRTK